MSQQSISAQRIVRCIGFSISYPFFALGCLILALAAPFSAIGVSHPVQRVARMRYLAHKVARGYLTLVTKMQLVEVDWPNARVLPAGLIVANHPSLVDAVWILATQPHIALVLKADLERFRVLRYLADRLGYVSNNDPEKLLQEGSEKLQAGETLLVFPEATRTEPGIPLNFRLGAAELALRAGAPLHPIVIYKMGRYLSKACPWYAFPDDKLRWRIHHAESFQPQDQNAQRKARRILTQQLQEFFQNELSLQNQSTGVVVDHPHTDQED